MALKRDRKAPLIDTSSIGGALSSLLLKGIELFTLGGQALSDLADNAQKRAAAIAFKIGVLLILLLWVSVGILLALLGLFFLLIDQAGVPRGLVFGAGGAILALVALLLLKFAKQNADTADL
jgi:uncharacterized membrane protein